MPNPFQSTDPQDAAELATRTRTVPNNSLPVTGNNPFKAGQGIILPAITPEVAEHLAGPQDKVD